MNISQELINNEAKIIYDMIQASCNCNTEDCKCDGVFNYSTTLKGIEATAVVSGNSIIVTYVDGTLSTYTAE
jgi:hypothetical protein